MSLLIEERHSDLYIESVNRLWNKNEEKIEVSVIIPTYNKFPLNLLTLYSLERQTFDKERFEVILLDDASVDETYDELTQYKAPFAYKYVKCLKNRGRALIRNKGIDCARGEILIFLDAEMIVDKNFIQCHVEEQRKHEKAVITGAFHLKYVYTTAFPPHLKNPPFAKLLKKDKSLKRNYETFLDKKKRGKIKLKKPYTFFSKEDINKERYKIPTEKFEYFTKEIIKNYGETLENFHFPWMTFMTGNVSLRRDFIIQAGKFDEDFQLYGYEDWELGYRLFKLGAQFKALKSLSSFHQDHPVSENKWSEAVINYHLFCQKHPDVDVLLLGLELARFANLMTINLILREYNQLTSDSTQSINYRHLLKGFQTILETTAILLKHDIRHKFLYEAAGIDKKWKEKILKELALLKKTGEYPELVKFFKLIK